MPVAEHPNWVTFETVNALRFPYNPVSDTKWTRWCRLGKVPCCKFPDGWRVDLTRFDAVFAACFAANEDVGVTEDDPDHAMVARLNRQLGVTL